MSHKKRITLLIIVLIILTAGYFVYPLISPLFIDKKVSEAPLVNTVKNNVSETNMNMASSTNPTAISLQGNFVGFDRIHTGTGTVNVTMQEDSHIIRFEPDFSVQNGPDLYVGLGKDGKYIEGSEIALLKGNIGSQNYVVNTKFDTEKYNEVWIWCKQFSTPFARAVLQVID